VTRLRTLSVLAMSLALVACTGGSDNKKLTGTAGTGAGAAGTTGTAGAGAGAGTMGSGGAGTQGTAGTGAAGTAAGSPGAAGSGAAGSTTGAAGASSDGGAGAGGSKDAGVRDPDAGPLTTAGCSNHNYQLCIDFENGIDTTVWSGGTPDTIVTGEVAHGTHSYLLYSAAKNGMPEVHGGRLLSKTVGTIKNQVWARFYIHFKPGAPGGHGNIIAAYDQNDAWYELGYQFDGMMGVWHGGGGENPLRSMPLIVDQWYCVEAYFDGANAAVARWWIDGTEAAYYMPGGGPKIQKTTQFKRMEAGLSPYAKFDLKMPDGKGDQSETRVMTDLWIDDVAFDTQRIGCIE
jgi:hypothetical protein